jgi:hypothetical protein
MSLLITIDEKCMYVIMEIFLYHPKPYFFAIVFESCASPSIISGLDGRVATDM